MEPGDDCSLLPGKPAVKEIIFSPLADTQNLDAEVRFFTRRSQTDIREFKLLIKCTQQRAVPVLSTTFIKLVIIYLFLFLKESKAYVEFRIGLLINFWRTRLQQRLNTVLIQQSFQKPKLPLTDNLIDKIYTFRLHW